MPQFSATSKQRLETCHPDLRQVMNEVVRHFDCSILCGHRGKEEQEAAFSAGHSKAHFGQSAHNYTPALAVDVVPYPIDWRDLNRMRFFAGFVLGIATAMGINLRWGGDWDRDTVLSDQRFNDFPHFELADWKELLL